VFLITTGIQGKTVGEFGKMLCCGLTNSTTCEIRQSRPIGKRFVRAKIANSLFCSKKRLKRNKAQPLKDVLMKNQAILELLLHSLLPNRLFWAMKELPQKTISHPSGFDRKS
jgi:hypothetical protein